MKTSKTLHWGALGALGLALLSAGGCHGGGLVGGDCAPGWVECGAECVDLANDPNHCGACDDACGEGALCGGGVCAFGLAGGGTAGGGGSGQKQGFGGQGGSMSTAGRGSSDNWGGEGGIAGEGGRGAESGGGGESGAQSGSGGQGGSPEGGAGGVGGAGGEGGHGGAGTGGANGAGGAGGQGGSGGAGQGGAAGQAGQGGTNGNAGQGGAQGGGQGGADGNAGEGGANGQGGANGTAGQGGAGADAGQGGFGADAGQGGFGADAGQGGTGAQAGQGGAGGESGQGGAGQGGAGQGGAGQAGAAGQGGSGPCDEPLTFCDPVCVDLQNDEFNCGTCGHVCPTGVCQSGGCVGAKPGHEVVVGFDYASVPVASVEPKRILGNAVFLTAAQSNGSWRVLGFDPHGSPTRAAVDAVVAQQAASRGVTNLSVEYATDVPALIAQLSIQSFDALLVYDQPAAPPGALASAGATVETALRSFSSAGGCVVVLGGGGGVNEMWSFVQSAAIVPATGSTRLALPASLHNSAPADGVGIGIATVFAARPNTASWQLASPDGVVVIATSSGDKPVVIHKPVLP